MNDKIYAKLKLKGLNFWLKNMYMRCRMYDPQQFLLIGKSTVDTRNNNNYSNNRIFFSIQNFIIRTIGNNTKLDDTNEITFWIDNNEIPKLIQVLSDLYERSNKS